MCRQGQYYIEDLKSRNHTFVNGKEVSSRTVLRPEDKIKICDFLYKFHDEQAKLPLPPPPPPGRFPNGCSRTSPKTEIGIVRRHWRQRS